MGLEWLAQGVILQELCRLVADSAGTGTGGCQTGLNLLSGQIYPPAIRSTGAGWALSLGRAGALPDLLSAARCWR
jgi:hypothetical protein